MIALTTRSLLLAIGLASTTLLGGCLVDVDPTDCFNDGVQGFRYDPATGMDLGSNRCCAVGDDDSCKDFYRNVINTIDAVADSATCNDSLGSRPVCASECEPTVNCECRVKGTDCDAGQRCGQVASSECSRHIELFPGSLTAEAPRQCYLCLDSCDDDRDCPDSHYCAYEATSDTQGGCRPHPRCETSDDCETDAGRFCGLLVEGDPDHYCSDAPICETQDDCLSGSCGRVGDTTRPLRADVSDSVCSTTPACVLDGPLSGEVGKQCCGSEPDPDLFCRQYQDGLPERTELPADLSPEAREALRDNSDLSRCLAVQTAEVTQPPELGRCVIPPSPSCDGNADGDETCQMHFATMGTTSAEMAYCDNASRCQLPPQCGRKDDAFCVDHFSGRGLPDSELAICDGDDLPIWARRCTIP